MRTLAQMARAMRAAQEAELARAYALPPMAERRMAAADLRAVRRALEAKKSGAEGARPEARNPVEVPEPAHTQAPVRAVPTYTVPARKKLAGVPVASLSARGRDMRARLERESEEETTRPTAAAARFSRVYPSLMAVAPPVIYKNGKRVDAASPQTTATQATRLAQPSEDEGAPGAPTAATASHEALAEREESAMQAADGALLAAAFAPQTDVADAQATSDTPPAAMAPEPTEAGVPADTEPARRRRWPWLAAAAVVVAGGYAGTAAATADTVPEGTTVAGVDIGGLSAAEAATQLTSALSEKTERTLDVAVAGADESVAVHVADYSLGLNAQATVDAVTGFSLAPSSVIAHLFGGGTLTPAVTYDVAQLGEIIQSLQSELDGGYVDATIAFDESGTPSVVPSSPGLGVDPEAAEYALTVGAFGEDDSLELATGPTQPQISDEEAREALEEYAKPLTSAPLTIHFEGEDIEAPVTALAEAASFPPVDGKPVLHLDGARLAQVVIDTEPEGIVFGEDAKITIVDHERVEITPSTEGIGIDEDRLAADVAEAIHTPERDVTAISAVAPARFSTEDAEAMGITEIVAEIDTPITWEYVRTLNLEAGAAKTTGTLIKPGETFSLLDTLGPIDEAHGFYAAGMIIGGKHKDGVGGGLSQISTNTFNLGFRAGYEDIEHHPHSYYFDRYPMGAESTLAVPTLDMKWRNNTPYGAVIDSWVADGYVHSRLWSTKYWDVDIQTSEPRNIVYSGWRTEVSYTCEYVARGNNGFTVTVTRTVSREGDKPVTESNDVTYEPDYGTQCVRPTPKATQAPASSEPAADSAPAEAPAEQAPAEPAGEAPAE